MQSAVNQHSSKEIYGEDAAKRGARVLISVYHKRQGNRKQRRAGPARLLTPEDPHMDRQNRRPRRAPWWWSKSLLDDLTERDLYRFRASSALCRMIKAAGGRAKKAGIHGKLTFTVGGRDIECAFPDLILELCRAVLSPGYRPISVFDKFAPTAHLLDDHFDMPLLLLQKVGQTTNIGLVSTFLNDPKHGERVLQTARILKRGPQKR